MKKLLLATLLLIFSCEQLLESIKEGCTTTTACNYDATATKDDGSCLENDCKGVCGGENICGCTYENADNYNAEANVDDGNCVYTTCYMSDEEIKICTEELTESECYEYMEYFEILSTWSSTSSCSELGVTEIIDLCAEEEMMDTNHCEITWYCSGDCEFEELEELVSVAGCMLPDAPNYNSAALFPCTDNCIGNQTGANCCCEVVIFGCTDQAALNYSVEATTSCSSDYYDCCVYPVTGCTDQGASNFNPLATTDDGTCVYSNYGCLVQSACNYNTLASYDCSNSAVTIDEPIGNTDCCNYGYSVCYLDLNQNGYYESTQTMTTPVCDCGELGVGWVSEDEVSIAVEVLGCTQPVVNGQVCPEYNPAANVDNGSCCL